MKARISPSNFDKNYDYELEKHRRLGRFLYTDYKAAFTGKPFSGTPLGDKYRLAKIHLSELTFDDAYVDELLKLKDENLYNTACNPFAQEYSDDIVEAMSRTIKWGLTMLGLLGNQLPDWAYQFRINVIAPLVYHIIKDEDMIAAAYEEFTTLDSCWFGEMLFGTVVVTNQLLPDLTAESVRKNLLDCIKLFFLVYIIFRYNAEWGMMLLKIASFYRGICIHGKTPVSRAQTLATQGITATASLQRYKDGSIHTHNATDFFMFTPKVKSKFPCYKFKPLPDVKHKYIFYWQNINTEGTLQSIQDNYDKDDQPIDQDDYALFRDVIVPGFNLYSATVDSDLITFAHNILHQGTVSMQASGAKSELDEKRVEVTKLGNDNATLKRSLDKLRNRYNTLEAENKKLKESLEQAKTEIRELRASPVTTETLSADRVIAQMRALQSKYSKAQARIASLEKKKGTTNELESEIERLTKSLSNANALIKTLELELESRNSDNIKSDEKPEPFTQEELDLLAKVKCHLVLPDLPSLKELKHIMPQSFFTFVPNDCSAHFSVPKSCDFCVISTKMMGHKYYYRLKQDFKHKPDLLVRAHTVGNLAICRVVIAKCYELGLDKLDRTLVGAL